MPNPLFAHAAAAAAADASSAAAAATAAAPRPRPVLPLGVTPLRALSTAIAAHPAVAAQLSACGSDFFWAPPPPAVR